MAIGEPIALLEVENVTVSFTIHEKASVVLKFTMVATTPPNNLGTTSFPSQPFSKIKPTPLA